MLSERPVSVIITVYNEADNIEKLLISLLGQTRRPEEIVVVDGGSSDGTPEIIERVGKETARSGVEIRCVSRPGANISQGRNAAIEAASHELIVATDAGVRLPGNWLERLVEPFGKGETQVVAGFFRSDPDPRSPFQIAMGATVLPAPQDIKPEKFLPSSRSVAFTKEAWRKAKGYPEWLDYCEDLIFDLNLKTCGYRFEWQPQAVALFAPRRSLRAFWVQYYRYARGDGKAELFLKRHLLRYFIYGVFGPAGVALARRWPILWPVLVACGLGYVWKAYRRLFFYFEEFKGLPTRGKIAAVAWVPVIRATGDLAKMAGYPVGVRWRRRHRGRR